MKFDMATPCPQCPFRNDLEHGYLTANRIREIAESLFRQEPFPCHNYG